MATTLIRLNSHTAGRLERPSRPAVAQPAPGCAVEVSHDTFPVVLSTSALGKGLERKGSGPVTPGNWSVYRRVSVACWNRNRWPGQGSS